MPRALSDAPSYAFRTLTTPTTAGTTVAKLMTTEAWQQTHDGLVRVWRRFRPEHAAQIERELAQQQAVLAADPADHGETPAVELGALWADELPRLLADPQAARELAALLRACIAAADASPPGREASGDAQRRTVKVRARRKGTARSSWPAAI